MEKLPTKIYGAYLLKPRVFKDSRGFFLEGWNREIFQELVGDFDFVQDNHSRSGKNVLRGLHYQAGEKAQGKLAWVTAGKVYDVFVDLRKSSPTYGLWDGYYLTEEEHERLWIPPGCAHGFLVVSELADFHYKVTTHYSEEADRSLRWNDPELGICWPLTGEPILSDKDRVESSFCEAEKYP